MPSELGPPAIGKRKMLRLSSNFTIGVTPSFLPDVNGGITDHSSITAG